MVGKKNNCQQKCQQNEVKLFSTRTFPDHVFSNPLRFVRKLTCFEQRRGCGHDRRAQPVLNVATAKVYLSAKSLELLTRTWGELIELMLKSYEGPTQRSFANQHGVGLSTLVKWLRLERDAVSTKVNHHLSAMKSLKFQRLNESLEVVQRTEPSKENSRKNKPAPS